MAAYTDKATIEAHIGRTLTTGENTNLTMLIEAVGDAIDQYTGSRFDTVSETTRKYDGGYPSIHLDPCQSITAVKAYDSEGNLVTTYTDFEDYVAEPINETIKREIRKRYGAWGDGIANVYVTAKFTEYDFTNSKVPDDIKYVATLMVADFLDNSSHMLSESIEGYSRTFSAETLKQGIFNDETVLAILEQHREVIL